jgi:3-dehydro-4-phosphotetronate decarboxylase
MKKSNLSIIKELQQAGKRLFSQRLTWGSSGNISARTDDDHFLITATGTNLGELELDDFVECSVRGPIPDDEGKKPSKEYPMHAAIYRHRPDIEAVLHASPFYSTLIACSDEDILRNCFVESMYYLERIEWVPYADPGSEALAELIAERAEKANVFLLKNHGVLVCDTSIKEALMALETLEMACRLNVEARSARIQLAELPDDRVVRFLEESAYKPRREWRS